jgi:hypothetical protein
LRVDLDRPSVLRWSADGWVSEAETPTRATAFGFHAAELPTAALLPGASVVFTWRDAESGAWLGGDHTVEVTASPAEPPAG